MDYKDEMIGEICDNAEAWEVIELVDMGDTVYEMFEGLLKDFSNDDLIEAFEYHVGVDYDEFLEEHEMSSIDGDVEDSDADCLGMME